MTVSELIEFLRNCDPEAQVLVGRGRKSGLVCYETRRVGYVYRPNMDAWFGIKPSTEFWDGREVRSFVEGMVIL